MKRQAAFSNEGSFFKGCLHLHSTRSDGKQTPEELMRIYADHGYDFLAHTDHRRYNRTNYLPETGLTVIPGMEIDCGVITEGEPDDGGFRTMHTVVIGPDDETNGYADEEVFVYHDAADQKGFQKRLDEAHAKNNLTFYCHPEWSSTPTAYFDQLKDNFGMEIYNHGCAIENGADTNAAYWDELLGAGQKLYGVATDDAHGTSQYCGGYVMVKAPSQSVKDLLTALKNGAFYSSCGPVIRDFYVEDGKAHLIAEGSVEVQFHYYRHPGIRVRAIPGVTMTEAIAPVSRFSYIRASVVDREGRRAWTNPIFLNEEV